MRYDALIQKRQNCMKAGKGFAAAAGANHTARASRPAIHDPVGNFGATTSAHFGTFGRRARAVDSHSSVTIGAPSSPSATRASSSEEASHSTHRTFPAAHRLQLEHTSRSFGQHRSSFSRRILRPSEAARAVFCSIPTKSKPSHRQ